MLKHCVTRYWGGFRVRVCEYTYGCGMCVNVCEYTYGCATAITAAAAVECEVEQAHMQQEKQQ